MIWGCLDWIINRRQIRSDLFEMEVMATQMEWMQRDLDRRVSEAFTPEEYAEVRKRCETQLAHGQQAAAAALLEQP
jgi:hypothetical protein